MNLGGYFDYAQGSISGNVPPLPQPTSEVVRRERPQACESSRVRDLVSEDVQHLVFFSENNSLTVFTEDGVKGVCFEEVGRTRTSRASC